MAKKSKKLVLDKTALSRLGAERLAELLLEAAGEDNVLKRTLSLEIALAQDADAAARELTKRVNALSRARSFIDWRKSRDFARDLDALRDSISKRLGAVDPAGAYELLWAFMEAAGACQDRCDDSNGSVGSVFAEALAEAALLGRKISPDPAETAARVEKAIDTNDYGQFDGVITLFAPVLGGPGILTLRDSLRKSLEQAEEAVRGAPEPALRTVHGVVYMSASDLDAFRPAHRLRTLRYALQEIADIEGDVDAFIAAVDPETRTAPSIAGGIARRLVAAGRPVEALAALDAAKADTRLHFAERLDSVRFDALDAAGRAAEAQEGRWNAFLRDLDAGHLRDHLSRLPDFEDFEAELRALDHAEGFAEPGIALAFLVEWPDLERAARLVQRRPDGWNGDDYELLSPAADALEEKHPLAATILRRAMIDFTLARGRSSRYGHAARHLKECQAARGRINDYGPVSDHDTYVANLRRAHGRKSGFWSLVG